MNLLQFISNGLYLTDDEAISYIMTIPRRYKKFYIKKRSSQEYRLIAQPARQVKSLQKVVLKHIDKHFHVHENAFAYEYNKDIRKNALLHSKNQFILKMDFKNFFLSIKPILLKKYFNEIGIELDKKDIIVIENLFFWKLRRNSPLRLSIGAPSSPKISNVVMYFFDCEISKKCKQLGIEYSRYADDLTFSTNINNILFSIPKIVRETLNQVGLNDIKINHKKTVFSSKKFNRHVTGVTITNDKKLSLGRERKRLLRSKIHHYTCGILSETEILKLRGELGFAKFIEPTFFESMVNKYGYKVIKSITTYGNLS
ncbi:TPA: retron St85 family RNA-directed DNA polymerase [Proteus mirabilis]|uniref:retron St85 family RNA-directed DNA polymerase n=1 Tax=Proteus mirabilis TaxID=584 RepID=UPI0006671A87|nr:retron St85 family RNA-directed DNA polymerase [Proteus mirabilis]QIM25434.1 RNA-directed DNA polymerase [Proteus mirabilis]HDU8670164.1 retron St85 family RNA-directed DNA polymerase [Proteus mirabilis]HEI9804480.1 retron St85 family RNA-directed DNA polymerase [Proteus mirabilis]HEK3175887.1 retron St85 family RNA-directed DNA polymerase [Proteus mirabilis]